MTHWDTLVWETRGNPCLVARAGTPQWLDVLVGGGHQRFQGSCCTAMTGSALSCSDCQCKEGHHSWALKYLWLNYHLDTYRKAKYKVMYFTTAFWTSCYKITDLSLPEFWNSFECKGRGKYFLHCSWGWHQYFCHHHHHE